jgi:competence protein ComEA
MKYLPWAAVCAALSLSTVASGGPVNINSADATTLSSELKGVGPAKAAAIVEYRQKHGPFRSVDELALVKGIGQKFIDKNRADLKLGAVPAGKGVVTGGAAASAAAPPRKR